MSACEAKVARSRKLVEWGRTRPWAIRNPPIVWGEITVLAPARLAFWASVGASARVMM